MSLKDDDALLPIKHGQMCLKGGQVSPYRAPLPRRVRNKVIDGGRVCAFLRRIAPIKTAECISDDTGVNIETVRKMLLRESAPSYDFFMRLIMVYGPDFLCAVLPKPPDWLNAKKIDADFDRLKRLSDELNKKIQQLDI